MLRMLRCCHPRSTTRLSQASRALVSLMLNCDTNSSITFSLMSVNVSPDEYLQKSVPHHENFTLWDTLCMSIESPGNLSVTIVSSFFDILQSPQSPTTRCPLRVAQSCSYLNVNIISYCAFEFLFSNDNACIRKSKNTSDYLFLLLITETTIPS